MIRHETPEMVPVLSRGKHRSPRKGACFMEYASLLAGEKWSDHPRCTHPLLAGLARDVNDHISDAGRRRLVPLIPSVIGLNGDDPRIDVGIATRCAVKALPVAAASRQRTLAAGILAARRVLDVLDDESGTRFESRALTDDSDRALSRAPLAAKWAEDFINGAPISPKAFRKRSAPSIVRVSVTGIAEACIPDPDDRLFDLLDAVIENCSDWLHGQTSPDPAEPAPTVQRRLAGGRRP